MPTILKLQDVSKRFLLRHNRSGELKVRFLGLLHAQSRETVSELWALRGVSIEIGEGESIGLVGRNGSGKSTLLKLIAGIHRPTRGKLLARPALKIGTLIELGVGFHQELTGQENVYLNAAIQGLSRPEIDAIYPAVVEYAGLPEFMDVPLKNYSSGMQMRLGFAVVANLDPDVLLLDEIFAVGDEEFQKRCQRTLEQFRSDGKTIIFVSHSSDAVRRVCRRVCLLEQGELVYDGDVDGGFLAYQRLMVPPSPAAQQPAAQAVPSSLAPEPLPPATELDHEWHRRAVGGRFEEIGHLQFEFLKRQGLRPEHYLLDVGCGSLRAGVHFIGYLQPGHYVGVEQNAELLRAGMEVELPRAGLDASRARFVITDRFELEGLPRFDFAIAHSVFTHMSLNTIAICVASVLARLSPSGRFFATYFEASPRTFKDPIVRPDGITTYPDADPYHTSFEALAAVCEAVGARAERIGDWGHPRNQFMMVIRPGAGSAR